MEKRLKADQKNTSFKLGKVRRAALNKIAKRKKVKRHRLVLDTLDMMIALEVQRWQQHATNPKRK